MQRVLIVGHDGVKDLMSTRECIQVIEEMFKIVAQGEVRLPLRMVLVQPDNKGSLALMPAYLGAQRPVIGAKVITVFPGNLNTIYESHQGCVLLFASDTGSLIAIIDASSITALRTAAASAIATKFLAKKGSSNLAIIGSGVQASSHLFALREVCKIKNVRVWSRNKEHADIFVARHGNVDSSMKIESADTIEEAVEGAEIICTTTASNEPLLMAEMLTEGVHINAVGASRPTSRELDSDVVRRCRIYTDRMESLHNEAGDFLFPKNEGKINDDQVVGEIGDLLVGKISGRQSESEITLFKSLGIASEDLAAASYVYKKALTDEKKGTWVEI